MTRQIPSRGRWTEATAMQELLPQDDECKPSCRQEMFARL